MNQTLKGTLCLVLIALSILLPVGAQVQAAASADYSINKYQVAVILKPDGSAVLTEEISYQLIKPIKQFRYVINYAGAGSLRLEKISVSTQTTGSAASTFVEVSPANAASNQLQPMTYEIKDNGSKLQLQLNVLSNANSQRTVLLTYQLSKYVVRHLDSALLDHSFFASGDRAEISQPTIMIQLPQAVDPMQTWYFPVSLADFNQVQTSGSQLVFQAPKMADDQSMKLFGLMPLALFPSASAAEKGLTRDALTEDAHRQAAALRSQSSLLANLSNFLYVLLALGILLVFLIFWIFDKESSARFRQKYLFDLPSECPPAIAAILLHQARPGRLILSTLLDLVKRGELSLHGCVFTNVKPERLDYSQLATYEIYLINWLFGRVTSGSTLSTAEIRRFARDQVTAQEFQTCYQGFRQLLDEEFVSLGLIDTRRTRTGRLASWLSALVYLILSAIAIITLRSAVGMHLLIPAAALAAYGLQIRRLTAPGNERYAQCQALRRTLRNYSALQTQTNHALTSSLLPMAVGLGVTDRWLKQVLAVEKDQNLMPSGLFVEYGLASTSNAWVDQAQALLTDLKVMESMLSASLLMASGIHW